MAIYYWDSLKSQTSLQRVVAAEVLTIEVALELITELTAAAIAAEVVVAADIAAEAIAGRLGYYSGGLDIN